MTTEELTKLMAIIATEYPRNFDVTEERIVLWGNILSRCEYQDAAQAIFQLLSEARQFPPVVGEINQKIIEIIKTRARNQQKKQLAIEYTLPEVTEEQRQKNISWLRGLTKDLATKKAMRQ